MCTFLYKSADPDDAAAGYSYSNAEAQPESDLYFYHPDHLGSTSYVTDAAGSPTQFLSYNPYGETLLDEHTVSFDSPYKFNAKELDSETGLYYYGARYYDPSLSLWYGVDALTEKYNSISPYSYCFANPIRLVDPDGNGPLDRVKYARSYCGIQYKQEASTALRTEKTKEALEFMDCSELVCRVLADDGITDGVKHMASGSIKNFLSDETKFEHSKDSPQAGDIAVWQGHVGIVSETDGDKVKIIHASHPGKLSYENSTCQKPSVYCTANFYGYYHPKNENSNTPDVIYQGGEIPEVVVYGKKTSDIKLIY